MARRYPSHPAFDPIPRSTSADPYQRRAFYNDQFSAHTDTLVSSMGFASYRPLTGFATLSEFGHFLDCFALEFYETW